MRVPNRHGDSGWYDYRPLQASYPIYLWYLSQQPEDYARIRALATVPDAPLHYRKAKGDWGHEGPWLAFLEGHNPDYPRQILRATYEETLRRLQIIRADDSIPETRNVHHWRQRNPLVLEGLVQTMLGAPNHIYHGGLLHCRVRYFDPVQRRPGVPSHVAALVDRLTPDGISLQLVNLHATEPRAVILQAGAFGEHRFTTVRSGANEGAIHQPAFQVCLPPGTTLRLDLGMKRYVHAPTYAAPWEAKRGASQ